MAVNPDLNFNFTQPEQDAIVAGLNDVLAVLNAANVPYVNLTKDERKKTPSIGPARLPYVHDAVNNILPLFPALASPSIPLARATTLFQLSAFIQSVRPLMAEINDRLTDLGINAENLVYTSMTDSYETAQRQEGRMQGADVLVEAIKPLFEDQGDINGGDAPEPES